MHDGQRGDAVHVVVAVKHDLLAPLDRKREALGCGAQAGRVERVGQRGEAGMEEVLGLARVGHVPRGQQAGQQTRDAEFAGEGPGYGRVGRLARLPAGRHHARMLRPGASACNARGLRG